MIFVEQCYISTTENKNKSLLFFSRFLFFGVMLIFSAFFCQDFWKIWVVWTHTEMLQTKTCKNMLFFNEVFGCHAVFVIFFWFFYAKKTCKKDLFGRVFFNRFHSKTNSIEILKDCSTLSTCFAAC